MNVGFDFAQVLNIIEEYKSKAVTQISEAIKSSEGNYVKEAQHLYSENESTVKKIALVFTAVLMLWIAPFTTVAAVAAGCAFDKQIMAIKDHFSEEFVNRFKEGVSSLLSSEQPSSEKPINYPDQIYHVTKGILLTLGVLSYHSVTFPLGLGLFAGASFKAEQDKPM